MQEHHLSVTRTARYHTLGEPGDALREVWFVLHGYGMLSGFFIRHFEPFDDGHRLIVAPEALSRFYLELGSPRTGASWMTRQDREHEVEDYVHYLDTLYDQVFAKVDRSRVTVNVFGFSQGTATVSRWIARGALRPDRVILWGGDLAHDLDLTAQGDLFRSFNLTLVVGTDDEYIDSARLAEEEDRLRQHKIPYQLLTFKGNHRMDAPLLRSVVTGS